MGGGIYRRYIDGEGTITLTRLHKGENRRPCISIASIDKEMLIFVHKLVSGVIYNKKNYNPDRHQDSFFLYIKKKAKVFNILGKTSKYLRVDKKRKRANLILECYNAVTPRNEKYTKESLIKKLEFEKTFFEL